MKNEFSMTPEFKTAILNGAMGDISKSVAFDNLKIRLRNVRNGAVTFDIDICRSDMPLRTAQFEMTDNTCLTLHNIEGEFLFRLHEADL